MINDPKLQLEALIHSTPCEREFACLHPGGDPVCQTRSLGMEHTVVCLNPTDHRQCRYGVLTALGRFCQCPVRAHVERHAFR